MVKMGFVQQTKRTLCVQRGGQISARPLAIDQEHNELKGGPLNNEPLFVCVHCVFFQRNQ